MNVFPMVRFRFPLEVREVEQFAGKRNHERVNDLASLIT